MKKLLVCLVLLLSCFVCVGCGSNDVIQIGILQPVTHEALDKAKEGFIDALKEAGYEDGKNVKIIVNNAQGSDTDLGLMAKSLVSKCDLTLGIGTGAAQALKAQEEKISSTNPLLFTAVTDPVDAKLVTSNEHPGSFVTGTSDMNPVVDQIALIKKYIKDADKIGIFYTASETNSAVQAEMAKKEAEKEGLEVIVATATDATDLQQSLRNLCSTEGLDAIYIPTDNTVAANMNAVKSVVNEFSILTVCGEESMMNAGGHITLSVDYYNLGKKVGQMAVEILKDGKKPSDIAVGFMTTAECKFAFNEENIKAAKLEHLNIGK